jgi:hypothetical protein
VKRIAYIFRVFWHFRYYILCVGVMLVLWDSILLYPFRLFVVMVHEVCHAGAALMTGGEVLEIRTNWNESGHTLTRGGFFPLISSAGYVGSALIGALLIYTGNYPQAQRLVLLAIGLVCLGMTLWYTPMGGLDFYLGIGGGLLLAFMAFKSQRTAAMTSTWMGIILCLYSLYDFRTDLWMATEKTDAGILAAYWWGEEGLWLAYPIALVWVLFSLSFMYRAMRGLVRENRQLKLR